MTYELAKRLKDAGFPQGTTEDANKYTYLDSSNNPCGPFGNNSAYVPTLSELIEACGVHFSELTKLTHTRQPQRWVAVSYQCEECGIEKMTDGYGAAPEEAVAELWLALNTK